MKKFPTTYEEAISAVQFSEKEIKSNEALVRLMAVIKAVNGNWNPNFSDWSQPKYYIYSRYLYSVFFGGDAHYGAAAGFGCSNANYAPSHTDPTIGSRLCLKSETAAVHVIAHFSELLKDVFMVEQ